MALTDPQELAELADEIATVRGGTEGGEVMTTNDTELPLIKTCGRMVCPECLWVLLLITPDDRLTAAASDGSIKVVGEDVYCPHCDVALKEQA